MTEEQKNLIKAILNTLDSIPTMGKENHAKLYNCMDALQALMEGGPEIDKHSDNG